MYTKMSYEELNELYNEIKSSINNITDYITKSNECVKTLKNNWQGYGYKSYEQKFNGVTKNFTSFCNKLSEFASVIEKNIIANQSVDSTVSNGVQG